MYLHFVQHAEAQPKEVDPQRSLSDQGRADIRKVAAFLGDCGIQASRILHSGNRSACLRLAGNHAKPVEGVISHLPKIKQL